MSYHVSETFAQGLTLEEKHMIESHVIRYQREVTQENKEVAVVARHQMVPATMSVVSRLPLKGTVKQQLAQEMLGYIEPQTPWASVLQCHYDFNKGIFQLKFQVSPPTRAALMCCFGGNDSVDLTTNRTAPAQAPVQAPVVPACPPSTPTV
jgi:hypothetical protein